MDRRSIPPCCLRPAMPSRDSRKPARWPRLSVSMSSSMTRCSMRLRPCLRPTRCQPRVPCRPPRAAGRAREFRLQTGRRQDGARRAVTTRGAVRSTRNRQSSGAEAHQTSCRDDRRRSERSSRSRSNAQATGHRSVKELGARKTARKCQRHPPRIGCRPGWLRGLQRIKRSAQPALTG